MIKRCINLGILSKILFFISKGGLALLQDTPNKPSDPQLVSAIEQALQK